MMGFIHNDGEGLALAERRFHRFAELPGAYPCHLSIHKRIMQGAQDRAVILCPLETIGACSCGKDTGKGDETGGSLHVRFRESQQAFFEQTDQRGFADSAWTYQQHHRPRPPDACAFPWRTDRLEGGL